MPASIALPRFPAAAPCPLPLPTTSQSRGAQTRGVDLAADDGAERQTAERTMTVADNAAASLTTVDVLALSDDELVRLCWT